MDTAYTDHIGKPEEIDVRAAYVLTGIISTVCAVATVATMIAYGGTESSSFRTPRDIETPCITLRVSEADSTSIVATRPESACRASLITRRL